MNHLSSKLSQQNQTAGLPRSFSLPRVKRTKWESALWFGFFIAGCVGFKTWYTGLDLRAAMEAELNCSGPCTRCLEIFRGQSKP